MIAYLLVVTTSLPLSGSLRAGSRRSNSDHYGDAGPQQAIPLKIYRDFLVVAEGQLGGIPGRQNFILDTGTAPSIINSRLAEQLGLATEPSTSAIGGKAVPIQKAIVPEVRLGPITALSLTVQVQDLSRIERDMGEHVAAIIGLDVLSKCNFRLDYDKAEIEFDRPSSGGIPVHFDPRSGLAVAQVGLGSKTLRMLVDTGSNNFVLLGGNFADTGWVALRNTALSAASVAEQGVRVQEFSAPDIVLGGAHFSQSRAYLVPDRADPVFDGFLGVRALGFRALSFDQPSGTIYLQR
jgi:hypothetical protein